METFIEFLVVWGLRLLGFAAGMAVAREEYDWWPTFGVSLIVAALVYQLNLYVLPALTSWTPGGPWYWGFPYYVLLGALIIVPCLKFVGWVERIYHDKKMQKEVDAAFDDSAKS